MYTVQTGHEGKTWREKEGGKEREEGGWVRRSVKGKGEMPEGGEVAA